MLPTICANWSCLHSSGRDSQLHMAEVSTALFFFYIVVSLCFFVSLFLLSQLSVHSPAFFPKPLLIFSCVGGD